MRNAYYQLISRPSEICILRLAEIYNSSAWSAEITFSSKERDHRGQGEWKIGKRSPHLLKTQSANKRKESQFKDQPLAAPFPKKTNKEKTIGKKSLSPILFERRGRLYKGLRLWRFFFFALNFFLVKFFSRHFLDFE